MHLRRGRPRRSSGFSLVEVMITVVVLAIGFLGLARMQTVAVSSTQVSRVRSLVAIQASSLVSAMHANSAYWAELLPTGTITVTGNTVTSAIPGLTTVPFARCVETDCTPVQLAATDLQNWADNLSPKFSGSSATLSCTAKTTTTPTSCNLEVRWVEKYVTGNSAANTSAAALRSAQEFTLYVEP
jgi:type IV pilus assembly protein PilV